MTPISEICIMLVSIQMHEKVKDYAVNLSEDLDMEINHMSNYEDGASEDDIDANILDVNNRVAIDMDYKRITELTGDNILRLEFGSKCKACDFYSTYANCHVFVLKRDNIRCNRKGNIVMSQLLCNREGLQDEKHVQRVDRLRTTSQSLELIAYPSFKCT